MGLQKGSISGRTRLLLGLLLGASVLAALRGAVAGTFIFDDYSLLALPRFFDSPLLPFWQEHVEGGLHYRPLGLAVWWVSERLFGSAPVPHYLLNAALLGLVAIALWRLLTDVSGSQRLAYAVSLGVAVHPIAIGTASWLSNRFELLAALFGLLALRQAWRYRCSGKNTALLGTLVWFACALCAKENTVALIAAACVFWSWPSDQRPAFFDRRQSACLWLVALGLAWLLVRLQVLAPHGADALFAAKPAWILFRDGMGAWLLKLPSYMLLLPRLGTMLAAIYALGILVLLVLVVREARCGWHRDRVALFVAGMTVACVAAIVQWPRTGFVLMNLDFGADAFLDVLAARFYFMAALGFALILVSLLGCSPADTRPAGQRHIGWICVLLTLIPLFSVSQHLARSYRGKTLLEGRLVQAAVAAIDARELPRANCQIYLLGTRNKLFGFFADPAIKALTRHLAQVSRCYIQTEFSPWYHLVDVSELQRAREIPFTPVRVGADSLAPIVLGRGALVFANLAPGAAPPLGAGSIFLDWRGDAFVDVGDDIRAGRRAIEFACFRPPSQCP